MISGVILHADHEPDIGFDLFTNAIAENREIENAGNLNAFLLRGALQISP